MLEKTVMNALATHNIAKEDLFKMYCEQEMSLTKIKEVTGLQFHQTLGILRFFGIRTRGISESQKTKTYRKEFEETIEKRFGQGIKNPSQAECVKEKKRQTFLKNYGVDNIWKSPSFKEFLDGRMLELYGQKRVSENYAEMGEEEQRKASERRSLSARTAWENKSEESKSQQIKRIHKGGSSEIEKAFGKHLDFLGIEYETSFYLGVNQFDYRLSGTNILIEINGDFWHGNPSLYVSGDVIRFPVKSVLVDKLWEKDEKKRQKAIGKGFVVITFWERFLKKATEEEIRKKVYDEIKVHSKD